MVRVTAALTLAAAGSAVMAAFAAAAPSSSISDTVRPEHGHDVHGPGQRLGETTPVGC